jgi:hypothetical protein
MHVEDRGQVGVGLKAFEPVEDARRAVQRHSWFARAAVEPHSEQPVQVDTVIRVLVGDGNGVYGTVWPVRKQPRKGGVAEVQYQAVAVPVHRKTAARAVRLRKRAATAEHGDLSHSSSMPARACRVGRGKCQRYLLRSD